MNDPIGRARRAVALLALVSAQFMVMLDTSIVNVALPTIQDDLGLTQSGIAWVVNAYFLTFGGFLLLAGRASDIFGRRRMFMLGSLLFAGASLLAGLAPTEGVLIGARLCQGLGAAILSPAALSILLVLFTGEGRAKAMSAWGAASAAGGAIGVFAGGLITATMGWTWIFILSVPVSLAAFALAPTLFGAFPAVGPYRRFDALGAATLTAGALAFVYSILSAADHGWLAPATIGGVLIGVSLLGLFALIERAAVDPLIPLSMFRTRQVSAGVIVGVLGGASRVCTFFLVALYLQQSLHLAPNAAGLAMVPTSLAVFAVSVLLLPRLIRWVGAERTLVIGLTLLASGLFWLSRTPPAADYLTDVLPGLLLAAAGVALSFTPSTMVIASGIATAHSGLASGLASSSSQIGGAIGVAAFSGIAIAFTRDASSVGAGLEASVAHGFHGAFFAAAMVALLAAAIALTVLRHAGPVSGSASQSDQSPASEGALAR
jgi:EmrB/QacA subfamily drug resistance transporter